MFGESGLRIVPSLIVVLICAASISQVVSAQQDGDLRLVGHGASKFSGRLEIFYNGEWGTICAAGSIVNEFSLSSAAVACRQMGFGNAIDVYSIHHNPELRFRYGEGTGPIFLDTVRCQGYESHLLRCRHGTIGSVSGDCSHTTDVAIVCSNLTTPYNGEVRLEPLPSSTSHNKGVVGLYSNEQWASLCYNSGPGAAGQMANVTCRQLGYTHAITFRSYTASSRSFWDISVDCNSSSEACLTECLSAMPTAMTTGGCESAMLLECGFDLDLSLSIPHGNYPSCHRDPTNHEGAVRLLNSDPDSSYDVPYGFLEIYKNGAWGVVCDFNVNGFIEENVVCKQLGFPAAELSIPFVDPPDSDGRSFYDISCTGLETSINECSVVTLTNGCFSDQIMHVQCTRFFPPYGSVTFGDGIGSRGTLAVFIGEFFYPVCSSNFNTTAGKSACKQLGYESLVEIKSSSYYQETNSHPFKISDSYLHTTSSCSEPQEQLLSCLSGPFSPNEECREGLDEVVLSCDGGGPEMNVRLVGPNSPIEGKLEVYVVDEWGSVCATGEREFGYLEASVVCRSLGYETAARDPFFVERSDNSTVHLRSVACSGYEESIFDCQQEVGGVVCSHNVAIECSEDLSVPDGSLRLNGNNSLVGDSDRAGRLEISYYGVWMTICGTYFSDAAAEVACRQLGYSSVVGICRNSSCYGEGEGFIHVTEDMCSGEESRLLDCNREFYTSELCSHSQDVGLECAGYLTTTTATTSPTPTAPNHLLLIILCVVFISLFLVIAFVIVVCCGLCVYKWRNKTEEGTWTSPSYRNGSSNGQSISASNPYAGSPPNNIVHSDEKSKKAQEQYDDALDVINNHTSEISISKRPNSPAVISKGNSPPSSPNNYHDSSRRVGGHRLAVVSPQPHDDVHVYQNVAEIHISAEEPPPNYDDLDLFPAHNSYQVQSSPPPMSAEGISSSLARATFDSGLGDSTHEADHKEDLRLAPPMSPGRQETML